MAKTRTPDVEIKVNNLERTISDLKSKDCKCSNKHWKCGGCGGAYFVGFIGAAIYYIQNATGFWNGVLGLLKAAVWPAFVVYKFLGM